MFKYESDDLKEFFQNQNWDAIKPTDAMKAYEPTEDEVMFITDSSEQRLIFDSEEHPFNYNEKESIKEFKLWCV